MDLIDAGCRLGLLDGVDHPPMAARSQKDESLAPEVESGRDLVPELIGDDGLRALVLRKPLRKAAHTTLHANFLRGRRQQLLETPQPNLARSESMVGDERRPFDIRD